MSKEYYYDDLIPSIKAFTYSTSEPFDPSHYVEEGEELYLEDAIRRDDFHDDGWPTNIATTGHHGMPYRGGLYDTWATILREPTSEGAVIHHRHQQIGHVGVRYALFGNEGTIGAILTAKYSAYDSGNVKLDIASLFTVGAYQPLVPVLKDVRSSLRLQREVKFDDNINDTEDHLPKQLTPLQRNALRDHLNRVVAAPNLYE